MYARLWVCVCLSVCSVDFMCVFIFSRPRYVFVNVYANIRVITCPCIHSITITILTILVHYTRKYNGKHLNAVITLHFTLAQC